MLTVLATVAVLAGCGGSSKSSTSSTPSTPSASSGVSPSAYVTSICAAIGPFEKDVQARSSALNVSAIKNAAQGKTALGGFLNAMVSDTAHAVSQLQAAGTPNVPNGKTIATAVVGAFTQLKSALSQAATQANSLPTSSAAAFKTAATALGTSVRSSMGNIGSGLAGLKSPQLEKAATTDPTCKSLVG